jgi:FAD dependent monooxygenase
MVFTDLDTRFSCVYGVSTPVPGMKQGVWYSLYRQNVSTVVLTGVGGGLHWFVFEDLGNSIPFGHTPRYNQDDINSICGRLENTMVTPGVTFGHIFANKTIAVMTPLEEGVVTNWSARRMVLIGDSGHKVSLPALLITCCHSNRKCWFHR